MESLRCDVCGSNLEKTNDGYRCPYCGALFKEEDEERVSGALYGALEDFEVERWAKAKTNLYQSVHAKYPSKEQVTADARTVLSIRPDDFLARMYLSSHDEDPYELNHLLAENDVPKKEAEETYRWLLPSLHVAMIAPLKDFVMRHFFDEERTEALTKIEEEAKKLDEGIYLAGLPRDVFLAYSSADMAKVIDTVEMLEENGFDVFIAARNLRHGKGSREHYLPDIYSAMESCKVFVLLSSRKSRSPNCDAFSVELAHLIKALPNKPRIEYVIEDYGNRTPYIVAKTMKAAFPTQEQCRDPNDLVDRIISCLEEAETAAPSIDEEALRRSIEEKTRREMEAKLQKELAKKDQERKELEERLKKESADRIREEMEAKLQQELAKKEEERKALEEKLKKESAQKAREEMEAKLQQELAKKEKERQELEAKLVQEAEARKRMIEEAEKQSAYQPAPSKKESVPQPRHAEMTEEGVIVLRKKKKK